MEQTEQLLPPPPVPPVQPVQSSVRGSASLVADFFHLQPPVFTGEEDHMLAERWIDQMDKCFEILCVEEDAMRIRLGTFQLRDSIESWWRSIRDSQDISDMTWEVFCQIFLEWHFPSVIRDKKNLEFIS